MKLTVGVTGHRDLLSSEVEAIREQVVAFLDDLQSRFPGLELEVLTGLADGADQLVAEVALQMAIPVVSVLPFSQAEYERDFNPEGLEQFRSLQSRSTVIELPIVENSEASISDDHAAREKQYAQLGAFISNHSEILLALWNGQEGRGSGGTADVVQYHLTGIMPGFRIRDESPNLLADNENDLTYHLVCSRSGDDGGAIAPFKALEGYWVTSQFGRMPGAEMPEDYQLMFSRLEEYRKDLRLHWREITKVAKGLLSDAPDLPVPRGIEAIDRLYSLADWAAVHYQKRFVLGLRMSYLLAIAMGIVFIIYSEMVDRSWLAWTFLGLFGTGLVFHLLGERREWHRKYLDYRALAEGLRVQVYWNLAGVIDSRSPEFAYDNFLQKQDVDLSWIRHVMRSASLESYRVDPPDDRWVAWVSDQWIGRRDEGGQLGFYSSKAANRSSVYRRAQNLGRVALWTGIAMAVFLGVFADRLAEQQVLVFMILMGILPLVAGIRDAYSHKKADKELIKQYHFMAKVLGNARQLLDESQDIAFQRRVLRAVGNAALEEHAEWLLMHRERPLEHGGIG